MLVAQFALHYPKLYTFLSALPYFGFAEVLPWYFAYPAMLAWTLYRCAIVGKAKRAQGREVARRYARYGPIDAA